MRCERIAGICANEHSITRVCAGDVVIAVARRKAIIACMCGRFARRSTREVLAEWFGIDLEDVPPFAPSFNIAPQSVQPVVRESRDSGKREFALLRWGLVPFWAKDAKIGYTTINARAEEAATKPAFRDAKCGKVFDYFGQLSYSHKSIHCTHCGKYSKYDIGDFVRADLTRNGRVRPQIRRSSSR